jgi:hypothetical protein
VRTRFTHVKGDALALVLGRGAQEGNEPAADRSGEIQYGLSRAFRSAPRAWMRLMMWTPSSIDLVARPHSASMSTLPVPMALIAVRLLMSLPDACTQWVYHDLNPTWRLISQCASGNVPNVRQWAGRRGPSGDERAPYAVALRLTISMTVFLERPRLRPIRR